MHWQEISSFWKDKGHKQRMWMILGALFLLLAIIGVFLPIIPQVPFAIISAYFFSLGSPKLHQWLRNHKHLGPPVRNWEDHRVVSPKMKVISIGAMIIGSFLAHWRLPLEFALAVDVCFLVAIVFLITRKGHKNEPGS